MATSVTTQLLPMLRSTVMVRRVEALEVALREHDAAAERDFQPELLRGGIPGGDRHARQVKRVGAVGNHAAKARTAAAESCAPDEIPVRVDQVVLPAIGVCEELDRCPQLLLELASRPEDFFVRFAV